MPFPTCGPLKLIPVLEFAGNKFGEICFWDIVLSHCVKLCKSKQQRLSCTLILISKMVAAAVLNFEQMLTVNLLLRGHVEFL